MVPASYYYPIFLYVVLILSFISCLRVYNLDSREIIRGKKSFLPPLVLCIALAIFIGGRPLSSYYFGDTINYALFYHRMQLVNSAPLVGGEWIWTRFMYFCSQRMDVSDFFTLVALGYFGFTLWACRRLAARETWIMVLFNLAAFSFFSYATNGIRNGLACTMTLVALSYMIERKKRSFIIAGALAFVSLNIHFTTALPLLAAVVSLFFIKSFKTAYVFWILSIIVSLVAGGPVTEFFASLGFDDRVSYLQDTMDDDTFRHTGFRWDFLIYSMMPIVLGYYVVMKRGIRNATYEFLLNTYTLSNAFWVMVIRANYSNRFAYLSWFLYPLVLAYPLLKMNVWDDRQGQNLATIMLAHVGFTWFMSTIYG